MSEKEAVEQANDSRLTADTVRQMSDNELRIKVAELCGWNWFKLDDGYFVFLESVQNNLGQFWIDHHATQSPRPANWSDCDITGSPNYPADLNAMNEAENGMTFEQTVKFRMHLAANSDGPNAYFSTVEAAMCHATARQRSEAFVLTLSAATIASDDIESES